MLRYNHSNELSCIPKSCAVRVSSLPIYLFFMRNIFSLLVWTKCEWTACPSVTESRFVTLLFFIPISRCWRNLETLRVCSNHIALQAPKVWLLRDISFLTIIAKYISVTESVKMDLYSRGRKKFARQFPMRMLF